MTRLRIPALRFGRRRCTPQARVLALLLEAAPRPWDLTNFVQSLSALLGRQIVVRTVDMPCEMTGVWMSTASTEYIFVTRNADCTRKVTIVAHEIAHLLLGHRRPTDHASRHRNLVFATQSERDAESVATAFVCQLDLEGRAAGVGATG